MAVAVRCPGCGKTVRLEAIEAGSPVMCPACGTRFAAPVIEDHPRELNAVPSQSQRVEMESPSEGRGSLQISRAMKGFALGVASCAAVFLVAWAVTSGPS